jgi:hypothetical protein
MAREDDIIEYCSECGRGLMWGEAFQKDGLEFCIVCKNIVGARMP